jgi:hypothetical protein
MRKGGSYMLKSIKMFTYGVAVIAMLALSVGQSAARERIEVSTTAYRSSGRLSFAPGPPSEEGPRVECDVTLHFTTARLIDKVRGATAGSVSAILTANNSFSDTCMALSPFLVQYESITGTLPTITGGRMIIEGGFAIGASFGLAQCLYETTVRATVRENPFRVQEVSSSTRTVILEPRGNITGNCPFEGRMIGTMRTTPTVTMILLQR